MECLACLVLHSTNSIVALRLVVHGIRTNYVVGAFCTVGNLLLSKCWLVEEVQFLGLYRSCEDV